MNPLYTMPHILIETSEGATAHSLQDELFQDRQIELVGEVTSESAYAIMLQLRYLQKAGPAAPITLYINSPGGEVSSGLALYDVTQAVKCPVRTVCLGTAASMAAILFASGDKRGILPHGRVMIHDPLTTGVGGSALTIDSLSRNLMQTRQIAAGILPGIQAGLWRRFTPAPLRTHTSTPRRPSASGWRTSLWKKCEV